MLLLRSRSGAALFARSALRLGVLALVLAAGWATARLVTAFWHNPPDPVRISRLRSHAPAGMVLIPAGWFWMGSDNPDADLGSRGKHRVWLPSYYVDRYPVSNREYAAWDASYRYAAGHGDFPATNIPWEKAAAYLRAHGKVLPTEAEWEKAARGTDGREYPWGNSPGKWLHARATKRSFCSIRHYPQPPSPFGVYDMSGSIWQWARDNIQGDADRHIIRGGASGYGASSATTYARGIEGTGVT